MYIRSACFILRFIILLFAISFPGLSLSSENKAPYDFVWKPVLRAEQRDDVSTYIYDVPGHDLHAFKGQAELPYSILSIVNMLMDIDAMPDWVYQLKSVEKQQGVEKPNNFYMAFKGIWPVKPRDLGVQGHIEYDRVTRTVEIYSKNSDAIFPPRPGYVRIPKLYNRWRLQPLANVQGPWTAVEFEAFVDVGGSIPNWIANMVSKSTPKKTIEGVQQQMSTGRYTIETIDELPFIPPGLEGYLSDN